MEHLLAALRAVAEPTRLRLVVLCARGELTVSELTQILGQSQPRVSRHLKLLCEAGLLDRFREGSWVFYRLSQAGPAGLLARQLVAACDETDPTIALDLQRLDADQAPARRCSRSAYFRENAAQWHRIRSLYVDEREVEAALVEIIAAADPRDLLDIGTGTGRMLEILAPRVERALGIDQSREMLSVARVNLERAGLDNGSVRLGDMYQLALPDASFDAVVIHQVLHYADRPAAAIAEAARVLRPGGILVLVDFAPHALEFLRDEHAHRRLGFADAEVAEWCRAAGLDPAPARHLPGDPLTVVIWTAHRPSARSAFRAGTAARQRRRRSSKGSFTDAANIAGPWRGLLAADPVSDFDAGPPRISFEFFPPKTPEMEERLWAAIKRLEPLAAALRLGDLRRRRLDPRAHPCDGAAHPPGNGARTGGASDLRRRDPRRDRRGGARILGGRHPPHRRVARRPARRRRNGYAPHPGGYRLCRRSGRRAEARSPISRSASPPIPKPIPRRAAPATTSTI